MDKKEQSDKLSPYDKKFINKVREENHLQLRKAKLNTILMNKRLRPANNQLCQLEIPPMVLFERLPSALVSEFDGYEGKYDLILQYLNNDFSSLGNIQFIKDDVVLFTLIKVKQFFEEKLELNPLLESIEYEAKLYNSIENLLMNTSSPYFLYEITYILINYCSDSEVGANSMLKEKLWKRLYDIAKLGDINIAANVIWIFTNLMSEEEIALKIFSTIHFDQLYLEYMKACKDHFAYFQQGITLLKNFFIMNKQEFIIREAFLYPVLLTKYQDEISFIMVQPNNNSIQSIQSESESNRRSVIEDLSSLFSQIVKVQGEHICLFFGESFLFSIIKLIKAFCFNPSCKDYLLSVSYVYKILSNLFEIGVHEQVQIVTKLGFLSTTEYLASALVRTPEEINEKRALLTNICFCLSNYVADSSDNASSVIEGFFIMDIIKAAEVLKYENDFICELMYVLYNAFLEGNKEAKERIIGLAFDYILSHIKLEQTEEVVLKLSLRLNIKMLEFARGLDSVHLLKMIREKIEDYGLADLLETFETCKRPSIEELASSLKGMLI